MHIPNTLGAGVRYIRTSISA